jgi:hypothetical protein
MNKLTIFGRNKILSKNMQYHLSRKFSVVYNPNLINEKFNLIKSEVAENGIVELPAKSRLDDGSRKCRNLRNKGKILSQINLKIILYQT